MKKELSPDQKQIKKLLQLEVSTPSIVSPGSDNERVVWVLPNGKIHRDYGPAVEWTNGNLEWYKNGKKHREGAPAYIDTHGVKIWWNNGKCHRDDGPAYIDGNEGLYYYIQGVPLKKNAFIKWKADNKNKLHKD
jgi:hypothetical protein